MQEEEITQQPPTQQQPKRILAMSTRGDAVWNVCQPILDYLIEYGDEETNRKALQTRAYWEQEQQWIINWANSVHYFEFAQVAARGLPEFKKMLASSTPETAMTIEYYPDSQQEPIVVDVVLYLALQAGERVMKQAQPTRKKVVGNWKRKKK